MGAIVDAERTSAPEIPLPDELNADVVVFPREVEPDGRGLYHDTAITIVKEFRAEGVSAMYQHDPVAALECRAAMEQSGGNRSQQVAERGGSPSGPRRCIKPAPNGYQVTIDPNKEGTNG
jgi:hypothetical protein